MISEQLITDRIKELYNDAVNDNWQDIQDLRKEMTSGKCTEDMLRKYDMLTYRNDKLIAYDIDKKISNVCRAFSLFSRMAYDLKHEFDAEVEDDTIKFKWSGNSLNYAVKMIAGIYNLHPSMFGFDSGFSEHEAVSEDGHMFKIAAFDDDTVIIKANLLPKQSMFNCF